MAIYPEIYRFPSKHLLVFNTSWRHFQGIYWRRLQHVVSVTIFCLQNTSWVCLANTFWRSVENFLKTSRKSSWRQKIVTLKKSWRRLQDLCCREDIFSFAEKTSWRQTKCLLGISVSNKFKPVSQKSISDKYKVNPKCIN